MRRTVLLLATMALTLLVASGVALAVTKIGTNGPDTLSGTNGSDSLFGKGGNDTLFRAHFKTWCDRCKSEVGRILRWFPSFWLRVPQPKTAKERVLKCALSRASNDTLLGGPGKHRLVGGTKVGTAYHTQGDQKNILGASGNDIIIGGRGPDTIVGGEGNDLLATGDTLSETADDLVVGGDGTDVINALSVPEAKALIFCGDGRDVVIVNRKDVVAADCEKVFVGLGSIDAWFEAIPEGIFEGLPPFFVFEE